MLYVSNAGLGNGLSREHVYCWLSSYGSITDIVMVQRKPYCFVVAADVDAARNMASLSGSKVHHEGISQSIEHFIYYVNEGSCIISIFFYINCNLHGCIVPTCEVIYHVIIIL